MPGIRAPGWQLTAGNYGEDRERTPLVPVYLPLNRRREGEPVAASERLDPEALAWARW